MNRSQADVFIYDYLGKLVHTQKNLELSEGQNSLNIALPQLKNGFYSIRLVNPDINYTARFIKL